MPIAAKPQLCLSCLQLSGGGTMRRLFAFATVLLLAAPAWGDWEDGDYVQSDLSSANLITSRLSGADLRDARLCNTVMPDDTTLYSGC